MIQLNLKYLNLSIKNLFSILKCKSQKKKLTRESFILGNYRGCHTARVSASIRISSRQILSRKDNVPPTR